MPKSTVSTALHTAFMAATHEIRERLGTADVGSFSFSMNASGRTLTDQDEVKLEYVIGAGWDSTVKGNDLDRCIVEVLRRKGWDDTNAPLSLPSSSKPSSKLKEVLKEVSNGN